MRFISLKLRNFTAFSELEICFAKAGVMGILGPTGVGKSSILDAITLALFGRIARYGASDALVNAPFMKTHSASCSVRLIFEHDGREFEAIYEIKRARKSPTGRLQPPLRAFVSNGEVLASGKKDCDAFIRSLCGLDFRAFTSIVILPQNQFFQFLQNSNFSTISSMLADLKIFSRIGQIAYENAKEIIKKIQNLENLANEFDENEYIRVFKKFKRSEIIYKREIHQERIIRKFINLNLSHKKEIEQIQNQLNSAQNIIKNISKINFAEFYKAKEFYDQKEKTALAIINAKQRITDCEKALKAYKIINFKSKYLEQKIKFFNEFKNINFQAAANGASSDEIKIFYEQICKNLKNSLKAKKQNFENICKSENIKYLNEIIFSISAACGKIDEFLGAKMPKSAASKKICEEKLNLSKELKNSIILLKKFHKNGDICKICGNIYHENNLNIAKCFNFEKLNFLKSLSEEAEQNYKNYAKRFDEILKNFKNFEIKNLAEISNNLNSLNQLANEFEFIEIIYQIEKIKIFINNLEHTKALINLAKILGVDKNLALGMLYKKLEQLNNKKQFIEKSKKEAKEFINYFQNLKNFEKITIAKKPNLNESEFEQIKKSINLQIDQIKIILSTYNFGQNLCAKLQNLKFLKSKENAISKKSAALNFGAIRQKLDFLNAQKLAAAEQMKKAQNLRSQNAAKLELAALIGDASGKKFSLIAQKLALKMIIRAANLALREIFPRYELCEECADDGAIEVCDLFAARARRSVSSLSGGETFAVSLAMALGLGALLQRRFSVQTRFIDEGFGSLDERSLDEAISALLALAQNGSCIGVISHVPALSERLNYVIRLRSNGDSSALC